MTQPIIYTSKTCRFCKDVKEYAQLAGVELEGVRLEEQNPHNLRSAPAIEYDGQIHIGLDKCMAFIRRHAKGA